MPVFEGLLEDYRAALRNCLAGNGEPALRHAYELGRRALGQGMGVLDIVGIHQLCFASLIDDPGDRTIPHNRAELCLGFLSECLSPYEMVFRGIHETNDRLRQSLKDLRSTRDQLSRQNEVLAAAHRTLQAERQRYRLLSDLASDAYLVTDSQGAIHDFNTAASTVFGVPAQRLVGALLPHLLVDSERDEFAARLRGFGSAPEAGKSRCEEWRGRLKGLDGSARLAHFTVTAESGGVNDSKTLLWLVRIVPERERNAASGTAQPAIEPLEISADRKLVFLASAGSVLATCTDAESGLASVALLAVLGIADRCYLQVFEREGPIRQFEVADAEDAHKRLGANAARLAWTPVPRREGRVELPVEPRIVDAPEDAFLTQFVTRNVDIAELRSLGFRSALVVPVRAGGRVAAALTLILAQSGRRFHDRDLLLAQELSRRCALAAENALLARELAQEREGAEEAFRTNNEFFAILSHELRTPLTPMLGWARIFKNDPAVAQDSLLSEGANALHRNAEHMSRLVEDCLHLARLSQGDVPMEKRALDLNHIILASAQILREIASGEKVDLLVELCDQELMVLGDATRLRQVFMNLLANAAKYTKGSGQVLIRSWRQQAMASVEVRDTGIGIEPRHLERIFEPFRRGGGQCWTPASGLGLGLAIAQRVVSLHGGEILAESEGPGCGSTFTIRLPLLLTERTEPGSDVRASVQAPPERQLRVLCVEDSRDILFLTKVELEMHGYKVLTADTADQGLSIAIQEAPDVLISDLRMPGMDGYQFIRKLRRTEGLTEIPAIALTGLAGRLEYEKALAAGFNACVTKPVDPEELAALVRKLAN